MQTEIFLSNVMGREKQFSNPSRVISILYSIKEGWISFVDSLIKLFIRNYSYYIYISQEMFKTQSQSSTNQTVFEPWQEVTSSVLIFAVYQNILKKFNKTFSKTPAKLQQPATPKSYNSWRKQSKFCCSNWRVSNASHPTGKFYWKRVRYIIKKLVLNFLILRKRQIRFLNRTSTGTRETFINVSLYFN